MALNNSEEGVEISFKIVEKKDEEVEVRFFFFLQNVINPDSKIQISYYPPDIEIRKILHNQI